MLMFLMITSIFPTSMSVATLGLLATALYSVSQMNLSNLLSTHSVFWPSFSTSVFMVLLTLWAGVATLTLFMGFPAHKQSSHKILVINGLLGVLLGAFSSLDLFNYYVFFEFSLIPILVLILGWGYQPERLNASISMLFYTVIASLPLLLLVLALSAQLGSCVTDFPVNLSFACPSDLSILFTLAASAGFLVKLPLFSAHLWLPRAHVEAPVEGSMLLAAVMLKLGGQGLVIVSPLLFAGKMMSVFVASFSLAGGALMALLCLMVHDVKVLIAYSSVAHMALAISSTLTFTEGGMWAAVLAYLAHGVTSSALFLGANALYASHGSRNLLLMKGGLTCLPVFSLFWFLAIMGNMGAPPLPNLLAEIFMIVSVVEMAKLNLIPLAVMLFLATAFSLNLFMGPNQPQSKSSNKKSYAELPHLQMNMTFHTLPAMLGVLFAMWTI